jgi:hypothetical protein
MTVIPFRPRRKAAPAPARPRASQISSVVMLDRPKGEKAAAVDFYCWVVTDQEGNEMLLMSLGFKPMVSRRLSQAKLHRRAVKRRWAKARLVKYCLTTP